MSSSFFIYNFFSYATKIFIFQNYAAKFHYLYYMIVKVFLGKTTSKNLSFIILFTLIKIKNYMEKVNL